RPTGSFLRSSTGWAGRVRESRARPRPSPTKLFSRQSQKPARTRSSRMLAGASNRLAYLLFTTSVRAFVNWLPEGSDTAAVNGNETGKGPEPCGVRERPPVEALSVRPLGSAPPITAQVTVPFPPIVFKVAL